MAKAELNEFEKKKKKLIRKKKQNRLKRRFIIFLFLFICTGTIFVVLKAPFFNVKTIVCIGQTNLSEAEVIKIAGAKTEVNIFSTGVGTMKRRLASHPGIAECNVRRLFPNQIKIWVRESKPVVCIEQGGTLLLADKNGQIIKSVETKNGDEAQNIAKLLDFKPASAKVGEYIFAKDEPVHDVIYDCIGVLDKLGMIDDATQIQAADLSDIKIEYQDRLSILLGGYEKMEYKLTFVKKVIEENLSKYEKAILDYRGSSLYVGPKTEESAPPPETETSGNEDAAEPKGDELQEKPSQTTEN